MAVTADMRSFWLMLSIFFQIPNIKYEHLPMLVDTQDNYLVNVDIVI